MVWCPLIVFSHSICAFLGSWYDEWFLNYILDIFCIMLGDSGFQFNLLFYHVGVAYFYGLWFQWHSNFHSLRDATLVCLTYLIPSFIPLPEGVEEVALDWASGVSRWEIDLVKTSHHCSKLPRCLWAREEHFRHMGTKRLPGMGHLLALHTLEVLPACCDVSGQVRSNWGLQRKSGFLD